MCGDFASYIATSLAINCIGNIRSLVHVGHAQPHHSTRSLLIYDTFASRPLCGNFALGEIYICQATWEGLKSSRDWGSLLFLACQQSLFWKVDTELARGKIEYSVTYSSS
ncbi:hypothetical protein DFH08DRAFT_803379 [Mycena albidolilacea]|uniref:Uncharacterized protein n=1 Tax=Mycena albidolilacea TaxID=1033008 RepID=A0AAD7EXC6_9AGAR|nr:hypothetical protein DFH08DRAFT_803379 [Mycena albidolilacea]